MAASEILKLSWEIQLALASGYAAYVLAYTGMRDRLRTIDVAFISLVFSLIATLALWICLPHLGHVGASVSAFLLSCTAGIAWRKIGRPLVMLGLRTANVSWSDDDPSALATLSNNNKYRVSQVAVLLDDGSWLSCDETWRYAKSPFGPFQLGPNGDVALYVTTITQPDGTERPQSTVRDTRYGDRLTYIPASRVRQITMRHLDGKPNHSSPEAAELSSGSSQPAREVL